MKSRTSLLLAAMLAAGAAAPALAQTSLKSGDSYVYAPTTLGSRNPLPYVAEPTASAAASASGPDQTLEPIVGALNGDASLKGSKLTVARGGDVLLMTGVTVTNDQMRRAVEVATSQWAGGKVSNAIQTEEIVVASAPQAPAQAPEASPQPSAQAPRQPSG